MNNNEDFYFTAIGDVNYISRLRGQGYALYLQAVWDSLNRVMKSHKENHPKGTFHIFLADDSVDSIIKRVVEDGCWASDKKYRPALNKKYNIDFLDGNLADKYVVDGLPSDHKRIYRSKHVPYNPYYKLDRRWLILDSVLDKKYKGFYYFGEGYHEISSYDRCFIAGLRRLNIPFLSYVSNTDKKNEVIDPAFGRNRLHGSDAYRMIGGANEPYYILPSYFDRAKVFDSVSSRDLLHSRLDGTFSYICLNDDELKHNGVKKVSASEFHYKGPLGEFDYNPKEFVLVYRDDAYDLPFTSEIASQGPYLHYVGNETDGSKIKIPEGITNCSFMFADCNIKTPPVIPEGVDLAVAMFRCCNSLQFTPDFPNSLHCGAYMFFGCKSLEASSHLNNITNCLNMFAKCESLGVAPDLPDTVTECYAMFQDCKSIRKAPKLPSNPSDLSCRRMFYGCDNLVDPGIIPQGTKRIDGMYGRCVSLTKGPENIPDSVESVNRLFAGCSNLDYFVEIPSSVLYARGMFDGCESLTHTPKLNYGIYDCTGMFAGCSLLTMPPTLPSSVYKCGNCFEACVNLQQPAEIIDPMIYLRDFDIYKGCASKLTSQHNRYVRQAHKSLLKTRLESQSTMYFAAGQPKQEYYKGSNGSFSYNTAEFQMVRGHLMYVGNETDGSKIKIPEGITNCSFMFESCNLETPPVIPEGVKRGDGMFAYCTNLKSVPIIPDSFSAKSSGVFFGCLEGVVKQGRFNISHRNEQSSVVAGVTKDRSKTVESDLGVEFDESQSYTEPSFDS